MAPVGKRDPSGETREVVIVLDFGAQYGQLIARKVRECGVYCEILPFTASSAEIQRKQPKAVIFSGGPASVYEEGAPTCARDLLDAGVPILGICYGHQLIARLLGGEVVAGEKKEYGRTFLTVTNPDGLFQGIADGEPLQCWMSHGDVVTRAPEGFAVLAETATTPVAAMADVRRRLFGVQFHPEVVHTPWGRELLKNFLYGAAECRGGWRMASFVEEATAWIREQVGPDDGVLCAVSGGVDSAVTAFLVHRAVGSRLTCVLVDHGLLRAGEADAVRGVFAQAFGEWQARDGQSGGFVFVDAQDRFLSRLRDVSDPEAKRRIIGEEFVRVFEEEARKHPHIAYLAQGTLYPDVIESGGERAATIKTHHNVGGLPQRMNLKLLEPLRALFKDEVRQLGRELGVPESILRRHPFPGPGLAIRILGEVTPERLEILRRCDTIALEELERSGWYDRAAQAFVVLAPVRSVGVMGDQRTYGYTAILRVVTTEDFMTADWARLPEELIDAISRRVVNEVAEVNRLVYDVTSKPPATIEWE